MAHVSNYYKTRAAILRRQLIDFICQEHAQCDESRQLQSGRKPRGSGSCSYIRHNLDAAKDCATKLILSRDWIRRNSDCGVGIELVFQTTAVSLVISVI